MSGTQITLRLPRRALDLLGGTAEEIEAFLRRQLAIELCSRGVNSHEACSLTGVDHDALVREIVRANQHLLAETPAGLHHRLAEARRIAAAYERRVTPEEA